MNPNAASLAKSHDIPLDDTVQRGKRKAIPTGLGKGITIARRFTTPGSNPLDEIRYERRTSRISNTNGSVVFEMKDAEIPADWSQVATDIVVSKYFRKAGVPQYDAQGNVMKDENGNIITGPERSVKQVVSRLAGCWRTWGEAHGYFATKQDAQAFEDELKYMLVHQMVAPNSPQWFNTGLHYAYGITGKAQGHYYVDPATGEVRQSEDAYTHPQPHACFIQSVEDDMVNEGGIMDLWVREARLFKYGSGTGTNFSKLRGAGEPLSGGGQTSGLMSFLKVGDRAAGAIKSGGTTRRAAKMVCLNVDHPDIFEFVNWKVNEEKKVAALAKAGYDTDFNGEAYATVSGQNSNNSIRTSQAFLESVAKDEDWNLYWRTELRKAQEENRDPKPCRTVKARKLWDDVCYAAWACADPGVQYDTTINEWHTCPVDGRINASNPCSEYMFLDNTACNLASINVLKFLKTDLTAESGNTFDVEAYRHAIRLWTIVLEISVLMAQFPSKEIARLSYEFRTLGLGYANLGAMLMRMGIPYDSEMGRSIGATLTAILTGDSYAMSAEMAEQLGAFPGYERNREHMLRVIRNHRRAAYAAPDNEYEGLSVKPVSIDQRTTPAYLLKAAKEAWDRALELGEKHGYRNAQTTVIAPTGTIGLLMDCDTTGIEPDFAIVKFKKLAGGGYMKIANQSVKPALHALRYTDEQVDDIMRYVMGSLSLEGAPHINRTSLKQKGFTDSDIAAIEKNLPQVFDISFAFNKWTLGDETMKKLGFTEAQIADPAFNVLRGLGFTPAQIEEANVTICGRMTVEGAPQLKPEHLPVFDCANRCGKIGKRYIHAEGHIRMMAAAQSFISGAISKTINLPNEATVEDFNNAYLLSWKLGIKANALYRDGSKMSQALSNKSDDKKDESTPQVIEKIVIKEVPRRRKLPDERMSLTHKISVAGHEAYVHVGLYEDGAPGEIFIKMSKEGSTLSGVMDTLALSLSMNLQYGVPLDVLCEKLVNTRFEPMGMTTNREIPMVKSIMDYLGRWLALKFLTKEKAQRFHNKELIEKSYATGTKSKEMFAMRLPVVDEGTVSESTAVQETAAERVASDLETAKLQGFTGSVCGGCGSTKMKRNGSCEVCLDCGATSGCS